MWSTLEDTRPLAKEFLAPVTGTYTVRFVIGVVWLAWAPDHSGKRRTMAATRPQLATHPACCAHCGEVTCRETKGGMCSPPSHSRFPPWLQVPHFDGKAEVEAYLREQLPGRCGPAIACRSPAAHVPRLFWPLSLAPVVQ